MTVQRPNYRPTNGRGLARAVPALENGSSDGVRWEGSARWYLIGAGAAAHRRFRTFISADPTHLDRAWASCPPIGTGLLWP